MMCSLHKIVRNRVESPFYRLPLNRVLLMRFCSFFECSRVALQDDQGASRVHYILCKRMILCDEVLKIRG